jgi:hypothetical protein
MRNLVYLGVTGVAVIGAYLYGQATSFTEPLTRTITETVQVVAPPPPKVEVSPVIVIGAMKRIFENNTFSMPLTADEVRSGVCEDSWIKRSLYQKCVRMMVPATLKAGFNKAILDRSRIVVSDETITINLGTPTINDVVIDHARVKVLNRDEGDGWLATADKNLQAKGFVVAEKKLRRVACIAGIHRAAALSAEKQYGEEIRNLLAIIGANYRVVFTHTLPKAC